MRDLVTISGALALAVSPAALPSSAFAQRAIFTDPVAYCRAVVTVDVPGRQYRGPQAPGWMRQLVNARRGDVVVWRCWSGAVYACVNRGVTGPCDKYDVSRTPSADVREYCRGQRTMDSLPAALTGHTTVYDWGCRNGRPIINRQFQFPDARGFMPDQWRVVRYRS